MIAVITGPGGSGKSRIAHEVVKHIGNCVNIVVDHVKHFISYRDFDYEDTPRGQEQWRILGENLALMTTNYHRHGYDVIINGFLDPPAWEALEKEVKLSHKILLLPTVEVVIERNSKREKDRLDAKTIRRHHKYFSSDSFYNDFIKIDSSNMTVEETTKQVLEILDKNWGEL